MAPLTGENFNRFSMLRLNDEGRFYDVGASNGVMVVKAHNLSAYLRKKIVLSDGVTDVFVWIHGWQNDDVRAVKTARRFFANLEHVLTGNPDRYPRLGKCIPDFVAVHWPSMSDATPSGYKRIRDRAVKMTTEGEAEFFLASVLGYLDAKNERRPQRAILRGRQGFCIHCLGHSFGGRFLTAAVKAAATPTDEKAVSRRATGYRL